MWLWQNFNYVTFYLHYLGHRIKYGNLEIGNTTQQLLPAIRSCCSIEFIESFWFCVILVTCNIGIYIWIYIYKISYINSFFVIFNCNVFLHCMLNIFEMKKNVEKLIRRLLHSTIHQVMWYLWVFIVNPFSLLWTFFSQENCVSFDFPVSCLSLSQSA